MQRLLEAVQDAMVVVDAQGLVVMINSEFERLLGWARADVIGQGIETFVPERYRGSHPDRRAGYLQDPVFRKMGAGLELSVVRRDGTEIPADISLASAVTDQGLLVTVAVRDLS